jgi:cell division protein FtsI/penicillin-binding protein 2
VHYFPIIIFKKNLMRIFIFFFFEIVFRLNNISIKMKKKPFDSQTAKKIINEYAERINLLSRENKVLRKQLEDANISLKINKEILYSHIKSKKNVSEECDSIISDLKNRPLQRTILVLLLNCYLPSFFVSSKYKFCLAH